MHRAAPPQPQPPSPPPPPLSPPPQQLNIACIGAGFSDWMHDTGANGCAQNAYAGAAWRCIEGYCLCQHELNPDTVTSVSACARPSS